MTATPCSTAAEVVDEPDAVDEARGGGVTDVGDLAERAGPRSRRQRRLERPRLAQDDGDLALGSAEEVERVLDPLRNDCAGSPAERRRDGPLEARVRLDAGRKELGSGGLERAGRRGEPLAALDGRVEGVDPGVVDVEPAARVGGRRASVALGHRSGVGIESAPGTPSGRTPRRPTRPL